MAADGEERTYGIWGFAALFVLIIAVGTWAALSYGTYDRDPTEVLSPGPSTTAAESTTTTSEPVPLTLLDGTPAPEEVEDIIVVPGQHTYVFRLPEEWEGQPTDSAVPPSIVDLADDEQHVTISMACVISDGSRPDAVRITEDPYEINVTPVVTGLSFGPPCSEGSIAGIFSVAFEEPVGSRRLVVTPSNADVRMGPLR